MNKSGTLDGTEAMQAFSFLKAFAKTGKDEDDKDDKDKEEKKD